MSREEPRRRGKSDGDIVLRNEVAVVGECGGRVISYEMGQKDMDSMELEE